MSIEIDGPDGKPVEVFVSLNGGMVDALIRATTEADWVEAALFYGLLRQGEEKDVVAAPGVNIDTIGPVTITPAVIEDDKVVFPAIVDNRHHVNLRIASPAVDVLDDTGYPKWKRMAINWTVYGQPDRDSNAEEDAKILLSVGLIDPATVKSASRVYL